MKTLYTILFVLVAIAANAQVIQNPGFEEWENLTNGNPEPVNWSSIQSAEPVNLANLAPQVLLKDSINPHTGNYCVSLKNISVFGTIVANGLATNGRVHADFNPELGNVHTDMSDPKWFTACTTRPDSLVGYYRYSPQGADITTVQALLHTGTTGVLPDENSTGWVGSAKFESPNANVGEWTRFSVPMIYLNEDNPEYILFNLSAGNGTSAVVGSQVWYDDFELVYNTVGLDQNVANDLLYVYSENQNIVIDMRKFGAGEVFQLEVYNVAGQLVVSDQAISGYTKELKINTGGVYICTLQDKDGLTLSKKVIVQ